MSIPFPLPESLWQLVPGIFSDTILSLIWQHSPTSIIYSLAHLCSISGLAEHLRKQAVSCTSSDLCSAPTQNGYRIIRKKTPNEKKMRLHQDLSLFSQMQYLNRPGLQHGTEATSWKIKVFTRLERITNGSSIRHCCKTWNSHATHVNFTCYTKGKSETFSHNAQLVCGNVWQMMLWMQNAIWKKSQKESWRPDESARELPLFTNQGPS